MRLRHYRMKWMCATTAPWALGVGMLVSFTASAGQDLNVGFSVAPAPVKYGVLDQGNLIPQAPGLAAAMLGLDQEPGVAAAAVYLPDPSVAAIAGGETSLTPGSALPQRSTSRSSNQPGTGDSFGQPPRSDMKQRASQLPSPHFPESVRHARGAPEAPLRPSLSRAGRDAALARMGATRASKLLFTRDARLLPGTIMMEGSIEVPELTDVLRFEPAHDGDDGATSQQTSEASPGADNSADSTGAASAAQLELDADNVQQLSGSARRAAMTWRRPSDARDGGTPIVRRAEALASTTPAPPDGAPQEIAAAPVITAPGQENSVVARLNPGRRSYTGLISPNHMEREQRCLAEAVYFEARSEPAAGQAAVAQVVLNRVKSGLYPTSVCGVVYQNRHRHMACQFTFACEGKRLVTNETASWKQAVQVAKAVYAGQTYLADVGGATHYHANYVRPRWAKKLIKNDVIGRHIFYQLRPGQT